jgi:hypothetical protein
MDSRRTGEHSRLVLIATHGVERKRLSIVRHVKHREATLGRDLRSHLEAATSQFGDDVGIVTCLRLATASI